MIISLVRVSEHDDVVGMITNLIIAIKIHKSTKNETNGNHVIVEYSSPVDAERAVSANIMVKGVSLEKDFGRSLEREHGAKKPSLNHKVKLYLGNLPASFTEGDLKKLMEEKLSPKSVFVSPPDTERRYAFVVFSTEAERNMALGVLEGMKQKGQLESKTVISPAYPYSQSSRRDTKKHAPSSSK